MKLKWNFRASLVLYVMNFISEKIGKKLYEEESKAQTLMEIVDAFRIVHIKNI